MTTSSALLLDALGTLVELPPPGPALREELAARFEIEVSEAQATRAIGIEIAYYRRHYHEAGDAARLALLRGRCAEVLLGALGPLPLTPSEMLGALLGALRFRAFPDAAPAIRAARAQGLRVVVASNWDVSLHDALAQVGLAPWLDGIVTSAEVGDGVGKPAPGVFRRALELCGDVAPSDAVHVGDTPVDDIEGALAAGLGAVLICRDGSSGPVPAGVPVIASLSELPGVLAALKPGH